MTKIIIKEPEGPYACVVDSGAMRVEVLDAFLGVSFVTDSGEKLSVSMRDSGFELHYYSESDDSAFDVGWFEFKEGLVKSR